MGLTVGTAACFLIFLYVSFELSYDSFHSKADRIYRIVCDIKTPTEVINAGGPSWAVPPTNTKMNFLKWNRLCALPETIMCLCEGDIKFNEENAMWAHSSLKRF